LPVANVFGEAQPAMAALIKPQSMAIKEAGGTLVM